MGVGWVCINKKIRGAVGAARILVVFWEGVISSSSGVMLLLRRGWTVGRGLGGRLW